MSMINQLMLRVCRTKWCYQRSIVSNRRNSVISSPRVEEIRINVGSSGSIKLNIYNAQSSGPVVFHLTNNLEDAVPRALFMSNSTVVNLTPRWSSITRFPTPLHDISCAFNWITKNLCSVPSGASSPTASLRNHGVDLYDTVSQAPSRPIALVATSILSSLALSVSLTESRLKARHRISAIAIQDGIYNFSILAQEPLPGHADTRLRNFWKSKSLFSSPENTFDVFASPLGWFMSPGVKIPSFWPGETPPSRPGSSLPIFDEFGHEVIPDTPLGKHVEDIDLSGKVSRKSYLTFQSKDSGIIIPPTRLAVTTNTSSERLSSLAATKAAKKKRTSDLEGWQQSGKMEDLLTEQAVEMRRLMRRSITMHEAKEVGGVSEEEANDRVTLVALDGRREDVEAEWVVEFLRDVL